MSKWKYICTHKYLRQSKYWIWLQVKKHSENWNGGKCPYKLPNDTVFLVGMVELWFFLYGLYKNGVYCGRRVRNLYSFGIFGVCRKCANLSYKVATGQKYNGMFKILTQSWKTNGSTLKMLKEFYRGKPTRTYRRYLKINNGFTQIGIILLLEQQLLSYAEEKLGHKRVILYMQETIRLLMIFCNVMG